MGSTYRL